MAVTSLLVGSILLGMKLCAYWKTGSAAIYSDAVENVVNVFSAIFAIYAVQLASRPADEDHPYGHGKVEFLSAGFEGGMILLAAMLIVTRAFRSLASGQSPTNLPLGIAVTAISAIACAATGWALCRRAAANESIALAADGVHLLSDAVTGGAVLVALLLMRWTHWTWLDPVTALIVGVWITWQAIRILRRSMAGLMDEQDMSDTHLLRGLLDAHTGEQAAQPRICSYHQLRHRHSGRFHWVDFHIQVPAGWAVEQGHRVATSIEMEIEKSLGQSRATAHVEPCTDANCRWCQPTELPAAEGASATKEIAT
jgi:cation diffusion facilitator family transporter